mgnify:FL=1
MVISEKDITRVSVSYVRPVILDFFYKYFSRFCLCKIDVDLITIHTTKGAVRFRYSLSYKEAFEISIESAFHDEELLFYFKGFKDKLNLSVLVKEFRAYLAKSGYELEPQYPTENGLEDIREVSEEIVWEHIKNTPKSGIIEALDNLGLSLGNHDLRLQRLIEKTIRSYKVFFGSP